MPCWHTGRMGNLFQKMRFSILQPGKKSTSMTILLSRLLLGSVAILELASKCRMTSDRTSHHQPSTFPHRDFKFTMSRAMETRKRLSLGKASLAVCPPWEACLFNCTSITSQMRCAAAKLGTSCWQVDRLRRLDARALTKNA